MSDLHDFLVKHATFPSPQVSKSLSASTTDISLVEVLLLEREWKANHAVRDNTLVQKLCSTLENILGDTLLAPDVENQLPLRFSPIIQVSALGQEDTDWKTNPNKRHSELVEKGILEALVDCLWVCGRHRLVSNLEQVTDRGISKVDCFLEVDGEARGLLEAKPPSVMNNVGGLLPQNGIELTWAGNQSLAPKILTQAALYLGLRRMEWLFITCHNDWIVCRLVRGDHHPFLAYSPMISIDNSSVPFRALLGAILSVVKKVPVEPTEFKSNMKLDTIVEARDGPLPSMVQRS